MNNGERGPWESGRELVRGVVAIVALGTALGLGYNALQLAAGPRHGLSWIRRPVTPVTLDSFAPAVPLSAVDSAGTDSIAAAPPVPTAAAPSAAPGRPAAAASAKPPARGTAATSPEAAVAPTDPGGAPPAQPKVALPVVPDTREPLEVGYDAARRFWSAGAAVFVDARSPQEYAEGHIPGAVNLDFDEVQRKPEMAGKLDTGGRAIVVTYCSGGSCELSHHLANALIAAGQRKVLVFTGGMPAWQASGGPVVTGPNRGQAP